MSRFSRLPGITDNGGYQNYVVGFLYVVVILAVLGAAAPGDESNDTTTGAPTTTATAAATTTATATPTTTAGTVTSTVESTPTATTTAEDATAESPTTTVAATTTATTVAATTTATTVAAAMDGEAYEFSGSGNDVTDAFSTEGGLVVLDFQHDGESNFQVQAVSSDGDEEFLVNDIGTYDGRVALYMPGGEWQLDVTADGSWSSEVTQPRYNQNDIQDLPASADGEHADYFGPYQFEGTTEVTFEIENDRQAAVWLTTTDGERVELLHNEIGPYEGSALVSQEGPGLIIVDTDSGDWRIEIGG